MCLKYTSALYLLFSAVVNAMARIRTVIGTPQQTFQDWSPAIKYERYEIPFDGEGTMFTIGEIEEQLGEIRKWILIPINTRVWWEYL